MSQGFKTLFTNYWKAYFRNFRQAFVMSTIALFLGFLAITRNYEIGQLGLIIFLPLLSSALLFPSYGMLQDIVKEKSTGTKEYLKLNGLSSSSYNFYLLSIFSIRLLIFILAIAIPYAIGSFVTPRGGGFLTLRFNVDPIEMTQLFVLWALATASFLLCVSLLFSDPNTAPKYYIALQILLSILSVALSKVDMLRWGWTVFPQGAFGLGVRKLSEWAPEPIGWVKLILLAQIFVYFVVYLYVDGIVTGDEHGISKYAHLMNPARDQEGVFTPLINHESVEVSAFEDSSAIFNEKLQTPKKIIQVNPFLW